MNGFSLNFSEMDRVAGLVDQIAAGLDAASVSREARRLFLREVQPLIALLRGASDPSRQRFCASLERLVALLDGAGQAPVTDIRARRASATMLRNLRKALLALGLGLAASLAPLAAAAPAIGTPITHPVTGAQLTVLEMAEGNAGVIAVDANGKEYLILMSLGHGQVITDPGSATGEGTVTVLGYRTSAGGTILTSASFVGGRLVGSDDKVVLEVVYGTPATADDPQVVAGTIPIVVEVQDAGAPSADVSVPGSGSRPAPQISKGVNGKNGRNGALFVPAATGKNGARGGNITGNKDYGNVTANGGPGILIASIGGDGGDGGDGYLGASGKAGGSAGAGGTVNVTVRGGTVSTTGNDAHGVVAQSRSGVGGEGGSSYAGSGTGTGGNPSNGGSVTLTNQINVKTTGNVSHGVVGQSLGGGGGKGGSSYGLFGSGASASGGGNGGNVVVNNHADILTTGAGSFGVFAQSVGGAGGDAGSAGGIVALTRSAGAGGDGQNALVEAKAGVVETRGDGSHGLFAQSIGGGGGNAGRTSGVVAVGGSGAGGGKGGKATVITQQGSSSVTKGDSAHAVFAQSIGGGGGNAGRSGGLVAIGGSGSGGGNANDAIIDNKGNAYTSGAGSYGLFGQSVGGGGGTGASTGGLVALGGSGGGGGNAGNVNISNSGSVETKGVGARGIYAQSIGGGGGDASAASGLVSLGGNGSGGGEAGTVSASNEAGGIVSTTGAGADGIFAQSVGGGGGSGGGGKGFLGIGGSGASGGNGKAVTVTNAGTILTGGEMARGILAQSIGGGGGVGGSGGGIISKGGSGGDGGASRGSKPDDENASIGGSSSKRSDGAAVTVNNSGAILTGGDYSSAIQAQSIGGGGGDGANSGGMLLSIGGKGGAGGKAGAVTIGHEGSLGTSGADSHGIFAQSIGGGGGSGGNSFSGGLFFSAAIGGSGGAGGDAGKVTLNLADKNDDIATIRTEGDRSRGVNLQAIGGGGGNGGAATAIAVGAGFSGALAIGGSGATGGKGGDITTKGFVDIETEGAFSEGMFLQSIGGGGGSGGFSTAVSASAGAVGASFALSLGGNAAGGGHGGTIIMDSGGQIITRGDDSAGLKAQSIGGGGGSGGFAIGAAGSAGLVSISASVALGGSGGGGGDGGQVDVEFDGSIMTEGESSEGAVIQSIGGGGGSGGFSVAGAVTVGGASAAGAASLGGSGGEGGKGGDVTGNIGGTIITKKDQSSGALVQSVGGGGGSGGFSVAGSLAASATVSGSAAVGVGGAGGGGGEGGKAIGSIGDGVMTSGDQSTGLIVQSIGGGGGSGGFNVAGSLSVGAAGGGISGVVGIGGAGGEGGHGGAATGTIDGGFLTQGDQSGGMLVQSVGGGGGQGGFNIAAGISGGAVGGMTGVVGIGGGGGEAGLGRDAHAVLTGGGRTEGAQSNGVTVQSIGGGGGSGGFNVSGGIAAGGTAAGALAVGLGGYGAGGGSAGKASANLAGFIETLGSQSDGALIQSIGGGGGAGGFNVSGTIAAGGVGSGSVGVGLGGSGGGGGSGGAVDVVRTGNMVTRGDQSRGLVAQSIGGGGGSGGFNVTGGIAVSGGGSGTLGVGLGGSGGTGGVGGDVAALITGATATEGLGSVAVIAQSIGGGGGSGGFNVTGGITVAGGAAGTVGVGLGGLGGDGGESGDVLLDITGAKFDDDEDDIWAAFTKGDQAGGVLAQSIGGGGGSGGFNVTGGMTLSGSASGTVGVGLGGGGGVGGSGGAVTANVTGMVITTGADSSGVVAQSVGGGGGSGGFNVTGGLTMGGTAAGTVGIGLGGYGAGGGDGGAVSGVLASDIFTTGDRSDGAVYQSLGGGGGSGGFNVSGGITAASSGAGSVSVGLGGSGGDGGDGGDVTVKRTGNIGTAGEQARGFVAQSIGGGGGSGAFNVTGNLAISGAGAGSIGLGLGGSGGDGGISGDVEAIINGWTATEGAGAAAVIAQSIGGGGGSGGFNVTAGASISGTGAGTIGVGLGGLGGDGGTSGDVVLDITGAAFTDHIDLAAWTEGDEAGAILAQSVGGGGGSGGFNVTGGLSAAGTGAGTIGVGLGGGGGKGADAGSVIANVSGLVQTAGDDSSAIVAQSVGGGGGSGGFNVTGALSAAGTGAGTVSVGLGGFGAGGGDGGAVSGRLVSDIITAGDRSDGVLYQSLGGGGGSGGFNVTGALSAAGTGSGGVAVGLGGFGGDGGHASTVSLDLTGSVSTTGAMARALVAQSIGGGGGNGGFNVSGALSAAGKGSGAVAVGIGGMGGAGGDAGDVSLTQHGLTVTEGADSDGVLALSLGGGGGTGGFNVTGALSAAGTGAGTVGVGVGGFGGDGGDAGNVDLKILGIVVDDETLVAALTNGVGATAIAAQSIGGGGGTGGFNVTGALTAASEGAGTLAVGVGGFGGGGGDAGDVAASVTGNVITQSDESRGILAQSIGGGGGDGGFNVAGSITASRGSGGNLSVGLGGFGGGGGDAGDVSGTILGSVSTAGHESGGVTYQSLGGGGGSGSFNVTAGITLTLASNGGGSGGSGGSGSSGGSAGSGGSSGFGASVGIGIGGFGGDGGRAGNVDAAMTGDIWTKGKASYGALFQSAGGGGGNGGLNVTGNIAIGNTTSASIGFGLGGFGGDGGRAGNVTANLTGDVGTGGDDAFGAMLQSIGGGGGNGGLNVSGALSISASDSSAVAAAIGVGGFGGGGGDAGDVDGVVRGTYWTEGSNADGVIAQSLGGGGGNGGMNIAGGISVGAGTSTSVAIGVGGFGGGGGDAGDVKLVRAGHTVTKGANSDAVVIQSIAGGGGRGGMNVSGSVAVTLGKDSDANSIALGLGGFGGDGGDAGDVVASVHGHVLAQGLGSEILIEAEDEDGVDRLIRADGSNGIVAQSIGGGGGNGGLNISGALAIDRPSSSGSGNDGGSDSGSGGSGSGTGTGTGTGTGGTDSGESGGTSRAISLGIGGFGGGGGQAGSVTLDVAREATDTDEGLLFVEAIGDDRSAVIAQSIGGGGGVGGIDISAGISLDQALQIGIGGFGGEGGTADKVVARVEAHVSAAGTGSRGIMAQSIGGGGGAGGINISGSIIPTTAKKQTSVTFGLGGFGGAGNVSDDVRVEQAGTIRVDGVDSVGLLAQSIAGGGGSGGLNIAAAVNRGTDGYGIAAGVGGFGGDGADAGAVDVTSRGAILINTVVTEADDGTQSFSAADFTGGAKGILAQSIGGGGGVAGINLAGVYAPKGSPITIGVGGSGGSGGDGGAVSVTRGYELVDGVLEESGALLATFGDHSDGLVAQSIGGGGGNGNYNVSLAATSDNDKSDKEEKGGAGAGTGTGGTETGGSGKDQGSTSNRPAINLQVGGSGAGAGSGDTVHVQHAGTIITDGLFSDAIVAQSIGGGGGDAGANIYLGKLSKAETFAVNLSLGGGTGAGGTGGAVSVDHDGVILTGGEYSVGVKAQSIGGGGGSAASDISAGGDDTATHIAISIGRTGGAGGAASDVDVMLGGVIQTQGVGSSAVLAQSIGGGGGDSTAISFSASMASKKDGASGGQNGGQSGGDTGGAAGKKSSKASAEPSRNSVDVSVGLNGGEGATGADVRVGTRKDMTIITAGDDARGIHAQSIGGGGGAGGGAANSVTNSAMAVSIAVGGKGGTGASAGRVYIANLADITTLGDGADAILAQSIGGGGGIGGSAETEVSYEVPKAKPDKSKKPEAKEKKEKSADASVAENGMALSVALGGTGGVGAIAGAVSVSNAATIATFGDTSYGIRAQSIGGGGGIGAASSATLTQGERSSNSLQLAIGGSGGDGAAAGAVDVVNSGLIYTEGHHASAISANSIGGGGGDGGTVTIEEGSEGEESSESPDKGAGEGGGKAGDTGQDAGAKDKTITTRSVSLGIGGTGGTGGTGGDVSVHNFAVEGEENSGTLITQGREAYGIFAQSIGGGGGNGSMVSIVSDLEATETSVSLNLAIGGNGGDGNRAGNVTVVNDGIIETAGDGAHGILAQSIGGGGGTGSMAIAVNAALSGGDTPAEGASPDAQAQKYFMAIGGFGGDGGDGGAVRVDNSGTILTRGREAHGIVAQSIGGGGGNAELGLTVTDNKGNLLIANALSSIIGGQAGGAGGMGGPVIVNHSGDITVLGEGSVAIKAESINGGGGSLTLNYEDAMGVALDIVKDKIKGALPGQTIIEYAEKGLEFIAGDDDGPTSAEPIDPLIAARAGGDGVQNSQAGAVTINSTGTFGVAGDHGVASLSQAIGGGGGSIVLRASVGVAEPVDDDMADEAGLAPFAAMATTDAGSDRISTPVDALGGPVALGFQLNLGSVDGVNNAGGAITDQHDGMLVTQGIQSLGLLTQSIGGGGGRGTMLLTTPEGALVGPIGINLGSVGGLNEMGDDVSRIQDDLVLTSGLQAHAALLQSIGAGGGSVDHLIDGEAAGTHSVDVVMGADGSRGGSAGSVTGQFSGGIVTGGDQAFGLIAQAIGGGGGETRISGAGRTFASLGGTDGTAGDGGTISLISDGTILTEGASAHAVLLQSIGGGGGLVVSDGELVDYQLNSDNEGDGGAISFDQLGSIYATGQNSFGLIAQSLGGGGGWIDGSFAGSAGGDGRGGAISLTLGGDVLATNSNATAIFAQSDGSDGGDDIVISLAGHVRGGSGTGAGLVLDGGADNRITSDMSLSSVSGMALMGSTGHDWMVNNGLLVGNIALGDGDNRVTNNVDATMIAYDHIDLGGTGGAAAANGANSFVNEGDYLMGLDAPRWPIDLYRGASFGNLDGEGDPRDNILYGSRVINTVELNGNFIQTATGNMVFDVAFGVHPSDRVNVSGDATVDGTAQITLTSLADAKPVTLFATGGQGVDHGLEVTDSIALDYGILADAQGIHLTYDSNFGQSFLRPNQRAVGGHMDSALSVGESEGIGRLMAALGNLMSGQEDLYQAIFDELNPEGHVAPLHAQLQSAQSFSGAVFGCDERSETGCNWVSGQLFDYKRDGDRDYLKVDASGFSTRIGFERPLSEAWSLSAAFGYDKIDELKVDNSRVTTSGEGINLGLGARGELGKLDLALTLSGGWSWFESKRLTSVFDETQALSSPETAYLRSTAELSYTARVKGWHFRPALELSATLLHHDGLREFGAGTIGYLGDRHDQSFVSAHPNMRFGYEHKADGGAIGFAAKAGAIVHSTGRLTTPVRFIGANAAADPAMLATPLNKQALTGSSYLYISQGNLSVGLTYEGEMGAHSRSQRYGAKLRWMF